MAWTHYWLCFRLLSPLHVGYRRTGNLMQTRPYVPGRLLWAALTARLTRNAGQGHDAQAYQDVGGQVQEYFRFGYLWPSLDGKHPYFPWEHPADFEYLLLGSYMSTSLHPQRTTAEEGSLHEVEFLAPTTRGDGRPVFLLGDLWVSEDDLPADLEGWKAALSRLQLGGERGYGWGRVRLKRCEPQGSGSGTLAITPGIQWTGKNDEIILTVPKDVFLPAHALAAEEGAFDHGAVQGPVEVLVGWGWHEGKYGLSQATVAYAPGAKTQQALEAYIGPNGLWQAKS